MFVAGPESHQPVVVAGPESVSHQPVVVAGYESVFEKKAFGGELELGDLDSFFKECDLYPSQAEIEEAMKATIRGVSFVLCVAHYTA